jgi:hypothetical protein
MTPFIGRAFRAFVAGDCDFATIRCNRAPSIQVRVRSVRKEHRRKSRSIEQLALNTIGVPMLIASAAGSIDCEFKEDDHELLRNSPTIRASIDTLRRWQ